MKKPRTSSRKPHESAEVVATDLGKTSKSPVLVPPIAPESSKPSNVTVCREAWETQKLRLSESEQGYFQVRTSASIVASFASGAAVAAFVALVTAMKDAKVGQLGLWSWVVGSAGVVAVVLLVWGAYLSLASALTTKVRDLPDPDKVIDKELGYSSEAQLYRQLISNAEGFICDHRNATASIGRRLKIGVRLLLVSTGLSMLMSMGLVYYSTMSNSDGKPITRSEPPMPPKQPAMDSQVIERGDRPQSGPKQPEKPIPGGKK